MGISELYRLMELSKRRPEAALKRACKEFEALLLHQILKGLDRTVPRSGLFREGLETKIYRDMFYQEVAREVSERGTGLSELLYRELSQRLMLEKKSSEKGGRDGQQNPSRVKEGP